MHAILNGQRVGFQLSEAQKRALADQSDPGGVLLPSCPVAVSEALVRRKVAAVRADGSVKLTKAGRSLKAQLIGKRNHGESW